MDETIVIFLVLLALIAGDVVTGILGSLANNTFKSKEMRAGLLRKSGTISLILLAMGVQGATGVIPDMPAELGIVYNGIAVYVALMEISSILENIVKINPDLADKHIFAFFGKNEEDKEDDVNAD